MTETIIAIFVAVTCMMIYHHRKDILTKRGVLRFLFKEAMLAGVIFAAWFLFPPEEVTYILTFDPQVSLSDLRDCFKEEAEVYQKGRQFLLRTDMDLRDVIELLKGCFVNYELRKAEQGHLFFSRLGGGIGFEERRYNRQPR